MPVEGQWRRANTPLNRRDKRLLAAAAVIASLAALALAIAYALSPAVSNAGCVVVDVPSTMGGARLRNCGANARAFCHSHGKLDSTIATACRRQGYATDLNRNPRLSDSGFARASYEP